MPRLKERELQCSGCNNRVVGLFGARRKFCTAECKKLYGVSSAPAVRTLCCKGCGELFSGHIREKRVFCGLECRKKYGGRPETTTIEGCGFCMAPVKVASGKKKKSKSGMFFCSREHANQWQGRNKIGGECETCGKSFLRSPSFIKRGINRYCSNDCRYKSDEFAQHMTKMVSDQQRQSTNKFEEAGYAMLDTLGIPYLPQHIIGEKFCVDAFIPEYEIVVQFDGDYWHGNRDKFDILSERQQKRVSLDSSQDQYFQKLGFIVIRIWESDFKKDVESVKKRIVEMISKCQRMSKSA
jgi:very-short-patch-repair endonuclease